MEKEDLYAKMVHLGQTNDFTAEIQQIREKLQDKAVKEVFDTLNQ